MINKPILALQWHITSKCDQRCKHCYIFNSRELSGGRKDLNFKDVVRTLESFMNCCTKLDVKPSIAFTGGDPLLREDFFSILDATNREANRKHFGEINIDVMGNPFHLNTESAKKLKDGGVKRYQISIDGMRKKHDTIRMKGSFDKSLIAVDVLKRAGIKVHVMFTLSKFNVDDFFPLVRLLVAREVDAFAFARLVRPELMPINDYKKISFSPPEYRDFLLKTHNLYKELTDQGYKTKFPLKDHLWKLFLYEQKIFSPSIDSREDVIYSGCGLGIANFSILSDGTVYACRRFPSPIGKVPEEELIDIFMDSAQLNYYRQIKNLVKCRKCELLSYCRGCGAVAYGYSGSFFDPDPQCWKIVD